MRWHDPIRQRTTLGILLLSLGVLALAVPLWPELAPERRLGLLLGATALIEVSTASGGRTRPDAGRPGSEGPSPSRWP